MAPHQSPLSSTTKKIAPIPTMDISGHEGSTATGPRPLDVNDEKMVTSLLTN